MRGRTEELVFRIAKNILGSREDAEECVNDAYLVFWEAAQEEKPVNERAYLAKTARNLALKRLEYNRAEKRNASGALPLSELENELPDDSFAAELSERELGGMVSDFLRTEKPEARAVFIRRYWYMDTVAEIARSMGFTESKVKSMLLRTRGRLKAYLVKEGIFDE